VNRDNTSNRPSSRILAEYRNINLKIPLALSDPQIMGDVGVGRNEDNDDIYNKESPPLMQRLTPITSFIPCERERANIDKANQHQIPLKRAFNLLRADKN